MNVVRFGGANSRSGNSSRLMYRPTASRASVSRSTTSFPSLPRSGGYSSRRQASRHISADSERHAIGTTVITNSSRASPSCSNWFHTSTQTSASGKIIKYDTTSDALVRRKIAARPQADHAEQADRRDHREIRREHFVQRHAAQRQAEHHDRQRADHEDAQVAQRRRTTCRARSPPAAAGWPAASRSSAAPSRR